MGIKPGPVLDQERVVALPHPRPQVPPGQSPRASPGWSEPSPQSLQSSPAPGAAPGAEIDGNWCRGGLELFDVPVSPGPPWGVCGLYFGSSGDAGWGAGGVQLHGLCFGAKPFAAEPL